MENEIKEMKIGSQIRKYRNNMELSQEQLAGKIYVSRQTVSNWENGKNYPDIHSLLLLSSIFNVSLDNLIKGDIEIMKEHIKETEIRKLDKYGKIYAILLITSVISFIPLYKWLGNYGFIPWGIIYMVTMFFALKTDKIKKDNNIHTYKEIVAFEEGKHLDEIEKIQEKAKRPYQTFLCFIISGGIALAVLLLMGWVMDVFHWTR